MAILAQNDFTIRAATERDAADAIDLWSAMMEEHEAFDPRIRLAPGAADAYRSYLGYHLTNADSRVGLALAREGGRSGRAIGFCLTTIGRNLPMFLPARFGYLSDLAVEPSERRKGVGRALALDAIGWLRERGIDALQLQVYARNEAGAAFWRAMGFDSFYDRMWLEI
jgi:ribosomal protein S18 acetylase RimI-like enzyme